MKISSKIMYAPLTLVFAFTLALPAHALDGKAWGGQCISVGSGGAVSSAACGDGASCTGSGRGGSDCTFTIRDNTSKEIRSQKPLSPNAKGSDPVILKNSVTKQQLKN